MLCLSGMYCVRRCTDGGVLVCGWVDGCTGVWVGVWVEGVGGWVSGRGGGRTF